MERETRRDLDGGLLLRRCLWHGKRRVVSYARAVVTGEGDGGMRVSEESLAERRGGSDSHESIIDQQKRSGGRLVGNSP